MSEPRYAIGVDLGTTHCALSFVDLAGSDGEQVAQAVLPIAQLTAPGQVEERPLLPSFLYLPHHEEFAAGDLTLPWRSFSGPFAGELARERGAQTPLRLVSSAKSWLSHAGADRRAALLPLEAPPEVERVSPLDASAHYLAHLRDAWNHTHPQAPFSEQAVTLTIPASFDPAARELTAEAARRAGCGDNLVLLEEPQAAVYSWIQNRGNRWRDEVKPGDVILVVDVGGGTTDLSLVAVVEDGGTLALDRIAVGDHILLGGDNMDLALAHVVGTKLGAEGTQLDPWQMRALTYGCRAAKEQLLSHEHQQAASIVIPSRGSQLIAGSIRTELTREEVSRTLVDGFFPVVESGARPVSRPRTGLAQLGLPYAQDAAITRHLAAFLSRQAGVTAAPQGGGEGGGFVRPTAVLFNGGVFKSGLLADRMLQVINGWLAAENAAPARRLEGADLDLAVARGAAYYSHVRRGAGVRIRGGTAKSYYVGVESSMPAVPGMAPPVQALCVAPFGMEEGSEAQLPAQEFGLVVGEPVRFRFFGSSVRRQDPVGARLEHWSADELHELSEIEITLPADTRRPGEMIPVRLHAVLTETGTLRLEALPREGTERWRVEFDVRGGERAA